MNLSARKDKYKKHGPAERKEKFILSFDLSALNLFCSYVLSENKNIRKSAFVQMRNLFNAIHEDSFNNDSEKLKRVNFIKRGLDARVLKNVENPYLIWSYINGGVVCENLIDPASFGELANEELVWIEETITACVKQSYMPDYIDRMENFIVRYRSTDYRNRGTLIDEFEKLITEIMTHFRRAKIEKSNDICFSLGGPDFANNVAEFHKQLTDPSTCLSTGMHGMNELLSGGFYGSRVYGYFGLPGEGKTTTLLNLAFQMKEANKHYTPKDPTRKPCIVFFSQENSVRELVATVFNMTVSTEDMSAYSVEEVIRLLMEKGVCVNDDSPIDIIIKYIPNMGCDTNFLYSFTEDLEDEGYEVICFIQDYIKRIRPMDFRGEMRLDLGAVINDFHNFACFKDIPVITASQLNRDATKHIDEGRKNNHSDLVRKLGRSNIGESMLILENLDGAFLIAPEYDQDGRKYLGIQRIKARYKKISDREHIYHPYDDDNKIRLVVDIALSEPAFKSTLRPGGEEFASRLNTSAITTTYHRNSIKDVGGNIRLLDENDSSNLFANASSSSKPKMPDSGSALAQFLSPNIAAYTAPIFIKPMVKMERPMVKCG